MFRIFLRIVAVALEFVFEHSTCEATVECLDVGCKGTRVSHKQNVRKTYSSSQSIYKVDTKQKFTTFKTC